MKILYGINSNGNGHLSRSRMVVQELRRRGHEVFVVLSGDDKKKIMNVDDFDPYLRLKGFRFGISNGQIDRRETLKDIDILTFFTDVKKVPEDEYDVAVSDYEPIVAWFAKSNKLYSIGLAHQYAFWYSDVPQPDWTLFEKGLIRYMAPVDMPVGIHWHQYNRFILPPFVQPMEVKENRDDLIVVYLPFEEIEQIAPVLHQFPHITFHYYTDAPGEDGNIVYKKFDRHGFIEDLQHCGGVISNAGMQLPSEAISLGKKIMVKPLLKQTEQEYNADQLVQFGFGVKTETVDEKAIQRLLDFEAPKKRQFGDAVPLFCDWLEGDDLTQFSDEFLDKIWGRV